MSYRHILAAISWDPADEKILARAHALAKQTSARLTVVTVSPRHTIGSLDVHPGPFVSFTHDEALAKLRALGSSLGVEQAEYLVLAGDPVHAISDCLEKLGVDLVALGVQQRDLSERLVGTNATGLLRHTCSDLLGVNFHAQSHAESTLIALDIEPRSLALLRRARAITPKDSKVKVLHVVRKINPSIEGDISRMVDGTALQPVLVSRASSKLDILRQYMRTAGFNPDDLVIRPGEPVAEIISYQHQIEATRLIISTGQHAGLGWSMACKANAIMHGVPCETLICRPQAVR